MPEACAPVQDLKLPLSLHASRNCSATAGLDGMGLRCTYLPPTLSLAPSRTLLMVIEVMAEVRLSSLSRIFSSPSPCK